MAHKYRLKGTELYESINEIASLMPFLRIKKNHEVLKMLEKQLNNSINDLETAYEALKQGQSILNQLT